MPAFTPKKLPPDETVGEILRQRRRYKNLKIETVAQAINIRADYLLALEEERWDQLPTGLYGKNFLKEYASFLGLKPAELLKNWQNQSAGSLPSDPFSQKIVKKRKFIIFPKIIRTSLIIVAVLICFLYLVFYFKKVISPPDLTISQPAQNLRTGNSSIVVSGWTEPEAEVKINNQAILIGNNGYFSQSVNLKNGLNSLVITSQNKYSQENIVTREILVD
jgi:cytoskeletal protein RodZ